MDVRDESFICPITCLIMVDPVIDYEGNSYEKIAIEQWLDTHTTSPITRNDLNKTQLFPNRALKNIISSHLNTFDIIKELNNIKKLITPKHIDVVDSLNLSTFKPVIDMNDNSIKLFFNDFYNLTNFKGFNDDEFIVLNRSIQMSDYTEIEMGCIYMGHIYMSNYGKFFFSCDHIDVKIYFNFDTKLNKKNIVFFRNKIQKTLWVGYRDYLKNDEFVKRLLSRWISK